ncbi:MAG: hypothetical protein NTZ48_05580 [Candidatus Omnitrophica bacterium]|nr:hypothetical protein [Candidatus Omnitrophota bacterium]
MKYSAISAQISIELTEEYPGETWEEIEDLIASALANYGVRGQITNDFTGNSTEIKKGT